MLKSLHIGSVRLLTNNPRKIAELEQYGVPVNGRIPLVIPPNPHNEFYLRTKATKSGHMIDLFGKEHLPEQLDPPIVAGMSLEQIHAMEDWHE
jgi:GTP cyclohydrolase II